MCVWCYSGDGIILEGIIKGRARVFVTDSNETKASKVFSKRLRC